MMARPLRIEYAGALYHVMARGNQGQMIYADEGDRKMWLATLPCGKPGGGPFNETRVSQAIGWVESGPTREVLEIRKKLTENTI